MLEINENIPFLWRLSSHNEEGFCMVSMVVPFNSGDESLEHTIETNVLSFTSDDFRAEEDEVLEWNEDDIALFLKLIANQSRAPKPDSGETTIKVDLSDPETIEIIQIVAAAGFGLALPAEKLMIQENNTQPSYSCEVGSPVSLNTINGYKRCIVADMEGDEVACVMLDKIVSISADQVDEILPHDLILVKKYQILHPSFTSNSPTSSDVLH